MKFTGFKKKIIIFFLPNYITIKINIYKIEHKLDVNVYIWDHDIHLKNKLKKFKKINLKLNKYYMIEF